MNKGINIAESVQKSYNNYTNEIKKPVVFLSHKSEDKDYVESIGDYFINAGINIYLDKNDLQLQSAVKMEDSKKITECIQIGISKSDYILCFVSNKTMNSWWVPYEIGYGEKSKKQIATLIRKDVKYIPDYLQIEENIKDISGINDFIKKISSTHSIPLTETANRAFASFDTLYIEKATSSNPLSKYLEVK